MTMNPYLHFVSEFERVFQEGKDLPLGHLPPPSSTHTPIGNKTALIFSPHPDDECIIGGLPLRLQREGRVKVINVAVTQGSNKARQTERWEELSGACEWLGFGLESTGPHGLEKVNLHTRAQSPDEWGASVKIIAGLLTKHNPVAIFFPHDADANSTHVGTHHLVMDALKTMPKSYQCRAIETEFWGQMSHPNLMAESSQNDVADLLAAMSAHAGELQRNPYHLRLPAWLQDNVRRGAELVGQQGGAAPDLVFATLYRVRQWSQGRLDEIWQRGRIVSQQESIEAVFEV
jgi:N-acetylglucosamine malate deacetylase 1